MANGLFNLKQVMQGIQQGGWNGQKPPAVEYLVVAGGGSGGSAVAGGGGAGGLLQGITSVPNGQTLLVTVGGGGASATGTKGNTGSDSVFGSITSAGGGGGASAYNGTTPANAGSGGSGGGAATYDSSGTVYAFGQGTSGQGNAGGIVVQGTAGAGQSMTAGGGGAGTVGLSPGEYNGFPPNGGAGMASAISGTATTYAGGGGGQVVVNTVYGYGAGGVGGGGAAGTTSGGNGTAGTANTGGGGGATWGSTNPSGAGGSGIVIVSYPDVYAAPTATTGSPTVSTSGSGSIAFNGSSAYIRYAGQSAFAFGTGDFTIEGWFYVTSLASGIIAWDFRTAGTNGAYGTLELSANGQVQYYANSAYQISSSAGLNTINTWAHIAIVRSGTVTKLFFNGTQAGSGYTDTTNYLVGVSSPYIGSGSSPSAYLPGYISNFRVVKGTAVYTANFTPPTAPLTAISGTSLLLNSASGAYLADGSTNGFAPAATAGSPAWNQLSPFTGTGYKNRVYTWTSSGSITF